jgi:hypothetical protein
MPGYDVYVMMTHPTSIKVQRHPRLWCASEYFLLLRCKRCSVTVVVPSWTSPPPIQPVLCSYILGVQEGVSNSLFHRVEALTRCKRLVLPETHDRVIGRGDGSFVSPKFTGIAGVW